MYNRLLLLLSDHYKNNRSQWNFTKRYHKWTSRTKVVYRRSNHTSVMHKFTVPYLWIQWRSIEHGKLFTWIMTEDKNMYFLWHGNLKENVVYQFVIGAKLFNNIIHFYLILIFNLILHRSVKVFFVEMKFCRKLKSRFHGYKLLTTRGPISSEERFQRGVSQQKIKVQIFV